MERPKPKCMYIMSTHGALTGLKNSHPNSAIIKYQCEKSCEIKEAGLEMSVMVQVDGKKFNNNNSGKFFADFQ